MSQTRGIIVIENCFPRYICADGATRANASRIEIFIKVNEVEISKPVMITYYRYSFPFYYIKCALVLSGYGTHNKEVMVESRINHRTILKCIPKRTRLK